MGVLRLIALIGLVLLAGCARVPHPTFSTPKPQVPVAQAFVGSPYFGQSMCGAPVFVLDDETMNAYYHFEHQEIYLTRSFVEKANEREIRFALVHECGHHVLKHEAVNYFLGIGKALALAQEFEADCYAVKHFAQQGDFATISAGAVWLSKFAVKGGRSHPDIAERLNAMNDCLVQ